MSDDFPYLEIEDYLEFPDPLDSSDEIIASGGNLSPGMLFSAYYQGIFPWYDEKPILWWSLDPRLLLFPEDLKVTKSMKKLFKKDRFRVTLDRAFKDVVKGCQKIKRSHEDGTWISDEILEAYYKLHQEGFAHSVEVWDGEELVGGLYGVSIGGFFAGESMFAKVSNASKYGFIKLVKYLDLKGFKFVDCQQETEHLKSLGAIPVKRSRFYELLNIAVKDGTYRGDWSEIFSDFSDFSDFRTLDHI